MPTIPRDFYAEQVYKHTNGWKTWTRYGSLGMLKCNFLCRYNIMPCKPLMRMCFENVHGFSLEELQEMPLNLDAKEVDHYAC